MLTGSCGVCCGMSCASHTLNASDTPFVLTCVCRLAHGRVLDGPDAVALTVACLKLGRDQNAESWLRLLRKRLDLPRHLSAADAVALVQQVAADK